MHNLLVLPYFGCVLLGCYEVDLTKAIESPRRGCYIKARQAHVGENATYPPHFGPFWAYSRTLPQGVELLV